MMTHEEQTTTLECTETGSSERVRLQTFKRSFEEICAGSDPWIPLGNFMHQFFGYYKHLRSELVCESIEVMENISLLNSFNGLFFVPHRLNIFASSTISPAHNRH